MKRKLGIVSECIKNEKSIITLDRINERGFESFFSGLIKEILCYLNLVIGAVIYYLMDQLTVKSVLLS